MRTISSKGQVTLPIEIREQLGLAPGTPVEFELREEGVLLRKGAPGQHPVDQVWATLRTGRPVDDLLDDMRGPSTEESMRTAVDSSILEMAVRYGDLEAPPRPLPSGYAALLYLFDLR